MSVSRSRFVSGEICGFALRRRSTQSPRAERLEERRFLSLTPGNPITPGTPTSYSGVGGTNTSGDAFSALQSFQTAIGGANNGGTASPQTGGFRAINWDAVKLDGTDFNGDTTVVDIGKTVGIPLARFQERGIFFEEVYAVSGDGFTSVNANAANLFPAFSPSNTFAMFNENTIDFNFVQPSSHTTTAVNASSRGFGAIFVNVQTPNSTSIELFHGDVSLGKYFVPAGAAGQSEFLGELFNAPVVTRAQLTLGTDVLFSFNGTTFSSASSDAPPSHNLVVADDFVYPEPVANPDTPAITGTQGQSFSGVVGRFSDSDVTATAKSFTGIIHWGDGNTSPATFVANTQGGFDVSGTNAFARGGSLPVTVEVLKFAGDKIELNNQAQVTPLLVLPVVPKGVSFFAKTGVALNVTVAKFTSVAGAQTADFSATIDWGDGTTEAGEIVAHGKSFLVVGTHTYATAGKPALTITITNAGGITYTAHSKANVKGSHIQASRAHHHAKAHRVVV